MADNTSQALSLPDDLRLEDIILKPDGIIVGCGESGTTILCTDIKRLMAQWKDPMFLNCVWRRAKTVWKPNVSQRLAAVVALDKEFRLLIPSLTFCSSDKEDIFASGFCYNSYFLNDPNSLAYEPQVFKRFKERAITRTWQIQPGKATLSKYTEQYPLAGLACRYFRFLPIYRLQNVTEVLKIFTNQVMINCVI